MAPIAETAESGEIEFSGNVQIVIGNPKGLDLYVDNEKAKKELTKHLGETVTRLKSDDKGNVDNMPDYDFAENPPQKLANVNVNALIAGTYS